MKRKVIVLVTVICFLVGCSSSTLIKSDPPAAKLYLDGQYKCETPCTYKDTTPAGSIKTVLLKKEGYKDTTGLIKKEELAVGPLIEPILVLFPFIWIPGYASEYTFEMEKL